MQPTERTFSPLSNLLPWVAALVLASGVAPALAPAQEAEEEDRCAHVAMEVDGVTVPADTATLVAGDASIPICYRAPAAMGRPVFGHSQTWGDRRWLVQYDTLWNTGVVFETPVALDVAGVRVQPGQYGLFAIPSTYEWVMVVSRDADAVASGGSWNPGSEVGRGLVRSAPSQGFVERFSVSAHANGSASADLVLSWANTGVHVPVRRADVHDVVQCELRGPADRLAERGSPPDSVVVPLGDGEAKVCYGAPLARERTIFGGLVPYNDMWRTGANEPTVIHLPFAAEIAGIPLDAGKYSLYTIPSPDSWIVIVNASTNQWGRITPTERGGRSQYSPAVRAQEMGRAQVPAGSTDAHVEQFRIRAERTGESSAELILEWERTRVRIPVQRR